MADGRLIEHDELFEDVNFEADRGKTDQTIATEDWIQALGGREDVMVRVYRDATEDTKGKQPFIFSFQPEDYNIGSLLIELRDVYGTGSYWVKGYASNGLIFNKRIAVENPKEMQRKKEIEREKETQTIMGLGRANSENAQSDTMRMMLEMQQKSEERILTLLSAMSQNHQPAAPPVNPTDMMGSMMGIMLQMKELNASNAPVQNPMDLVAKGIELAKELNPSDKETNGQDTLLELVKTFGQPIAAAVAKQQAAPAIISSQQKNTKQPAIENAQPANQMAEFLKAQTAQLIERAKAGSDPILYADVLLDSIPNLMDMLGGETIGKVLIPFNPDVAIYGAWFDELNHALYHPDEGELLPPDDSDLTAVDDNAQNSDPTEQEQGVIIDHEEPT